MISTRTKKVDTSKKAVTLATDLYLNKLLFDYTAQANIVSTVCNGKIILVNGAACKLLGYSRKSLLTKNKSAIFDIGETSFKKMMQERSDKGHSSGLVTMIQKGGKLLSCKITSAVFREKDGIEKSITTIAGINPNILKQSNIDKKKDKVVADNIVLAQAKSDARLKEGLKHETDLKERQILDAMQDAKETERCDIGKELHDNINQLLGASKLYMDMAKRRGKNSQMYLARSSQYTLEAIEEIRKLTKGLTSDIIKELGLCEAIEHITSDIMETDPIKISTTFRDFVENDFTNKFELTVYRIVQEQLNNILKHARAANVIINLVRNGLSIVLTISDDGVGFDTGIRHEGIGIANIKSRVAAYNGIADIFSETGKGCILTVTFPVTDSLLNSK